ncbi:hypothetical protein K439DRAFT_1627131 [Ramaria rubella]|nr:hypothetical protein K439DRAFT_1627131 [Ramaria rubella]
MLFSAVALSGLLLAPRAFAALTPAQVVTNINIVTTASGNLNTLTSSLSTSTDPADVPTIGQNIVTDFQAIITSLTGDVTAMKATPPFNDVSAQPIVTALRDFVNVHQQLLSTVIGKHAILAQFGVTAPVAAVLRTLEATIDSFAFAMINLIPTQKPAVQNDQSTLDTSVGNTITTYEQFCIPSPTYPTVQPVCFL